MEISAKLVVVVCILLAWNLQSIVETIYFFCSLLSNLVFSITGYIGIVGSITYFFWNDGIKERFKKSLDKRVGDVRSAMPDPKSLGLIHGSLMLIMMLFGLMMIIPFLVVFTFCMEVLPVVLGTAIGVGLLGFLLGWELVMDLLVPVGHLTTVGVLALIAFTHYSGGEKNRKRRKT
mmetsp:Transcript_105819/g.182524  ORF Transcript_105819/g.182524 Transcript_105819/m.182524 type:complete len:176 (-) Transcript_105819:610-1137(-)